MFDVLLSRLEKVRPRGKDQYMACCPAHSDRDPSLSIKRLSDGRILMKCFAECPTADVLAAVGMSMTDLFPEGSLGEYRSFVSIEREYKAKKGGDLEQDRLVLDMANAARKRGERLSAKDLEREKQAYLRVREAERKSA